MFKPGYLFFGSPEFKKDALKLAGARRIRMANYKRTGWQHDKLAEELRKIHCR